MELWPEGWGIICFAKIPLPHLSSSTVHSRAQNLYKFTFCANHLIAKCKEREASQKTSLIHQSTVKDLTSRRRIYVNIWRGIELSKYFLRKGHCYAQAQCSHV